MDSSEYQRLAMRTANPLADANQRLLNGALGLCGEAGEVADTLKKVQFHGHPLDLAELTKELGDVLWYVAQVCDALQLDLGDVMQQNIEKLRRRYPDGFSPQQSLHRTE